MRPYLAEGVGVRQVRFHDLRHSFASLLLQNGESPVYVKDQMGHSSIQATVDLYGHLTQVGTSEPSTGWIHPWDCPILQPPRNRYLPLWGRFLRISLSIQ